MSASSEQTRKFFDAIARRYDRAYAPPATESRARMARVLAALGSPRRVLDLGVGTGRELSSLLDAGHSVVGFDVSEEMLAVCARRARPVETVLGDFWRALPFQDASFDAVIALHGTLAHPPSESACSRLTLDVARVLRPGGVFLGEVPLPKWLERHSGEVEATVQRVGERGAWIADDVTGAKIFALLLGVEAWRAALSPPFAVETTGGEGEELFFVAKKQ